MRKFTRVGTLKYSRNDTRAGHNVLGQKYLSRKELEEKVKSDKTTVKVDKQKIKRLEIAMERELHSAWRDNDTLRPFIE